MVIDPITVETFENALNTGRITENDHIFILQLVSELKAFRGITQGRQNKIVTHLITWRHCLGPYQDNTIREIASALSELQTVKSHTKDKPDSLPVKMDYIMILKQFYRRMAENNLTTITEENLKKIHVPSKPAI